MQGSPQPVGTPADTELIDALVQRIKKEETPQDEVARRIGTGQGRISEWVRGVRAPLRQKTRLAIERYLRTGGRTPSPAAALMDAAKRLRLLAAGLEEEANALSSDDWRGIGGQDLGADGTGEGLQPPA